MKQEDSEDTDFGPLPSQRLRFSPLAPILMALFPVVRALARTDGDYF
jgi:hypothetical protein